MLEPYHVDFLRNLIADDRQGIAIQVDSAGKLPPDTVPLDQPAVAVACGLGNAVIRTDDPDREIDVTPEAWRAIAGPLWKWRRNPVAAPAFSYQAPGNDGNPMIVTTENTDPWGLISANLNQFRLPQSQLLDRLMPDGVRMVPLSVLATILFVFVVLIGPGDFFVLGWLRVRKLTWLTFPIATLAVSALTVWLSNSYMSSAETRRAAIIRDLGPSGEIVRTNRFELMFVASSRRVATEVEKGVFASLSTGSSFGAMAFGPGGQFGSQNMVMQNVVIMQNGQRILVTQNGPSMISGPNSNGYNINGDGLVNIVPTQVQGRMPTQFSAIQDLAKWTPQLNRVMTIPGTAAKPQVDWSQFKLDPSELEMIRMHQIPPKLRGPVREHFGPQAMIACFTGKDGWACDRSPGWRSTRSLEMQQITQTYNYYPPPFPNGSIATQAMGEAEFFRWIYEASIILPSSGIFTLTRQTSPKGGASCDDLPVLDSSDGKSWLLVIVVPENNDYVVYRKPMRVDD